MKTVLIVMPQFAPSSYPNVNRARFFAAHLPEFGWKPVVIAVEPRYLEEPPDWEYAKLVPPSVEVVRTKAWSARWTRLVGVGDIGIRSLLYQWGAAHRLISGRQIDAVLIPAPPWHPFLVGLWARRRFGVPYILDYTDPWVTPRREGPFKKSFWFRQMALWLEPGVVKEAAHIVTVSDGGADDLRRRYPFLPEDRFTTIPLGAERSDFDFLRKNRPRNRFFKGGGRFRFVYTGAMLPRAYDTLRAVFTALAGIRDENRALYDRLEFYFVGTTYAVDPKTPLVRPVAEEFGVADRVIEHPKRLPYLEANGLLLDADAVLGLGTTEKHYTASKIFPAILSGRPLVAVYHEASSVTEIARQTRAAELVSYSDAEPVGTKVTGIRRVIEKVADPGYRKPETDWAVLEKYSARNMTGRLAAVLDRAAAGGER